MTIGVLLDWFRSSLGGLCIGAGALLMLGSVLGMLRFPDVFTRLHAAGGAMSVGVCLALFGLVLLSSTLLIAAKLALPDCVGGGAEPDCVSHCRQRRERFRHHANCRRLRRAAAWRAGEVR